MKHCKKFVLLACLYVSTWQAKAQESLSLAGEWTVKLDEQKTGEQQQWYKQHFDRKIQLPGTLDDAGIGHPPAPVKGITKDVMLHLARRHSYIGQAWYAREIVVPAGWKEKCIRLQLERVIWNTRVWVDGQEAGTQESLSAPHEYDLSKWLTPGRHLIVIRIDNTRQYEISPNDMAHAYTEGTQIIWNGIIGKIKLEATNRARISSLQAYPSVKDASVNIDVLLQNDQPGTEKRNIQVQVLDRNKKVVADRHMDIVLQPGESKQSVTLALPGFTAWDEFNPYLYTVRAQLSSGQPANKDIMSVAFGMRSLDNHNSLLWINGRRLFLRGTLECNIFPLTGHPPMDKKGWLKVFTTARAYGLNHLRFHSWCPPEAAFEVADSLGVYVQVELPLWNKKAGMDPRVDEFEKAEALRISRSYGNHPSFCFWSMGNELDGDFAWLANMVSSLRQSDPRHLYTSTTFTFQAGHGKWPEPGDDYYITQYTKKGWVRGQGIFNTYPPDFKTDYTQSIDSIPVPIIIHEMGQYSVYPNMAEISKYTGVLDPLNFKAVRNDLVQKNMLQLAPAFTKASGKFSAHLYKEEIERALRTRGMSGFELLDLHDFPGQGTALIGILDAFWDSKGLVTPEEHRMYCSAVVPLIRFDKAIYTNHETFTATAEVANFGRSAISNGLLVWKASNTAGQVIASGKLPPQNIALGNDQDLGAFSFELKSIQKASVITIEMQLQGTPYKNKWRIWVYPEKISSEFEVRRSEARKPAGTDIVSTNSTAQALQWLQQGKKVLLNPDTADIDGVAGRFAPVFWSPVHFPNQPGTMGILCDPKHPALKNFPTDFYSDWQWWDLITSSKAMVLDSLPAMTPLVTVIDNFFKNRRMAEVIEARVGKGRLILVSADITHALDNRPAARQLRYSLEQYMASEAFKPATELTGEQLKKLAGGDLSKAVGEKLSQAAQQYRYFMKQVPKDSFPETFSPATGKWGMGGTGSWMSGFYPGALLYLFEATRDSALYREALAKMKPLEKEQYNTNTHDLGFMMYCPFGNARRIAFDTSYRRIILNSARSLASRFSPVTGCTRSWNSAPSQFMVIIDNMMNMELLCEATKLSDDSSFYRIATTHANTTLKNHFRPDYSSYHLVIYDPATGRVQKKQTVQGAFDESAWSRGQAWGLYGYTMMYRETRDPKYLAQAEHIANFILSHLPADKIPYWDYNAPDIPNTSRDVSAGAIACSALLELSGYASPASGATYKSEAEAMLRSLMSAGYAAKPGSNGGFLLKHGTGNHPKNSDIDVSLIYADYYYIEALMRYKQLLYASATRAFDAHTEADSLLARHKRHLLNTAIPNHPEAIAAAWNPDSQWPDISYTDGQRANWQLLRHLERVRDLSLAWSNPTSRYYHDPQLWRVISGGLDHWLKKRYWNSNWWHNEIGVPQLMRDIIVLLRGQLDSARMRQSLEVMGQYHLQPKGAGANLVWSAALGLHYGALTGDEALLKHCADLIKGEIAITTGEGVQPDYSFHQHGARLQMYQYGAAFLENNVLLAWELQGTRWAFPYDKIRVLSDFTLRGWQWMARGVNTVPGTMDRSASRIGALRNADIRKLVPYLCSICPEYAKAFRALGEWQAGRGQALDGFRYYPCSDFTAYQQPAFSFFLKTLSDRTLATESINSENLKGKLLNSGDAYVIRRGNEYYNLMPVWDWTRLPGVTAFEGAERIARRPFTGSVSGDKDGLTVMDYVMEGKDGQSLSARKYWACHDGVVVCLLAGLRQNNLSGGAYTTLDQCRWQGDVTENSPANRLQPGRHISDSAQWLYHNGVGYIFLQPSAVEVRLEKASGSWAAINASLPDSTVTENVFLPTLLHKKADKNTGYVLAPGATAAQVSELANNPSWKILRNDSNCQAIRFKDGTVMCAFYTKDSLVISKTKTITVDKSCLLLLSGPVIYAADPTQKGETIALNGIQQKTWYLHLPVGGNTASWMINWP